MLENENNLKNVAARKMWSEALRPEGQISTFRNLSNTAYPHLADRHSFYRLGQIF